MHATGRWYLNYDGASDSLESLRAAISSTFANGVRAMHVTGVDAGADPLTFWHAAASGLGSSIAIRQDAAVGTVRFGNHDWMDVRFEPSRQDTFRHACVAQPLHTDGAHVAGAGGFALMFMAKQAQSGGETVLVDAATVARILDRDDPALLRDVTELPVHMVLPPGEGSRDPLLARAGDDWTIRWNYYRVAPGQHERIDAMRERFSAALARIADSSDAVQFLLGEGDALILDDTTVLHGRRAFAASERSDRLMWKTYFSR